jgi:DNA-binding transcriptional LysR family regulator
MRLVVSRGVPPPEHVAQDIRRDEVSLDWNSARVFLDVARSGSFRRAAERLGHPVNHVRRQVEKLERQLGCKLLLRNYQGTHLTAAGQRVLSAAEQMEFASRSILGTVRRGHAVEGEVRVAVTDGLGTFWLTPRLVEFQRAYPKLLIDLQCELRFANVSRLEADIAIQLERPTSPDVKAVKLGRQFISLFASPSYINTYGCPSSMNELIERHRIVLLQAEQGRGQQYYDELFRGKPQPGFVAMRTNTSSTNYWAISSGIGLGWLPTYVAAFGGGVVPIDVGPRMPFDIWLTYHPEAGDLPAVRTVIKWLIETFDAQKFPWFRDEFIPSHELFRHYRGKPLVNFFSRFVGDNQNSA